MAGQAPWQFGDLDTFSRDQVKDAEIYKSTLDCQEMKYHHF